MIGDYYTQKLPINYPWVSTTNIPATSVTKEEFDALKKDVEEMKSLLKRAKIYDQEHGEPDCVIEEKVALLRRVAELVGVDLEEIL